MKKQSSQHKHLCLGMLAFGLIFLFTPTVNLIDPLPDFIGYFLIARSISVAGELTPYFADARERFQKLFWVSASKLAALVVMLTIYSGDINQRSIITVFAVGYAIVEAILLLPAFSFLFEGLFYLGVRHGCDSTIEKRAGLTPERLARLTLAFLVLRQLAACLPELALVPISDGEEQTLARMMLKAYPILLCFSAAVTLTLGAILWVRLAAYFRHIRQEGDVERVLLTLAEEKHELIFRRREKQTLRFAGILAVCAALFGMDAVIDEINLVPDFLSGLCLFSFFLAIGRRVRGYRLGAALAGVYTAVSLGAHLFSLSFFERFDILELYARKDDAVRLYRSYLALSAVELALSLGLSLLLALALCRLVPHVACSVGEETSLQTRRLHRSMKREAILLVLFRAMSAIAWVVYLYYAQFTKTILLDPGLMGGSISSNVPLVDGLWLVPPLLSAVELALALHLTGRFRTESELTYSEI